VTTPGQDATLEKVRKLLTKAEAEGVTPQEAEALTGKAAELMAKYGIDRALLAATRPETDKPGDRIIDIENPWARVQAHLLCGLAAAMRCQAVMLPTTSGGSRIHLFGFQSDLERVDVLHTSILLQMFNGLRHAEVPAWSRSVRAYRRSWLLGFASTVIARVKDAERSAVSEAPAPAAGGKTAVVAIADRNLVIGANLKAAYPKTRSTRVTYSGSGYSQGSAAGQRANIGGASVGRGTRGALH
jgi:hypothetical protein